MVRLLSESEQPFSTNGENMGFFRNIIDRAASYFEASDLNELEDGQEYQGVQSSGRAREVSREIQQPVPSQSNSYQSRPRTQPSQPQTLSVTARPATKEELAPNIESHRERMAQYQNKQGNVVIAIKCPCKYEDATEIVDLLIANECVLIDFKNMMDSQARRCIDFIDGASRVLFGKLQKVGSSMYLLTPSNVIVNVDDLDLSSNTNPEYGFDYDMKRR